MCGRYLFTYDDVDEIRVIADKIIRKYGEDSLMKTGEIYPTNKAPILIKEEDTLEPNLVTWGFLNYNNRGVIINARAETAIDKPTFRESLLFRRCIIPSTGFYEWNQKGEKHKYLFHMKDSKMLYMAGFYNEIRGEKRFVILTTNANDSVKAIHHRMPVVVEHDQINQWIYSNDRMKVILNQTPPMLVSEIVE